MANALKIRPLSDRIVVEPKAAETKTAGGIIIPDTAGKEKPMEGTVMAVGPGKFTDGNRQPMQVKVGDKVLFGKYAGSNSVKVDGKELFIMSEDEVMGVLE